MRVHPRKVIALAFSEALPLLHCHLSRQLHGAARWNGRRARIIRTASLCVAAVRCDGCVDAQLAHGMHPGVWLYMIESMLQIQRKVFKGIKAEYERSRDITKVVEPNECVRDILVQ